MGTCVGGTKVCKVAGDGYGECQGATVPAAEDDCATPEDENCNGASNDGCTCEPTSVGECYSGPAGTAGVGLCVAGSQTCKADATWGVCVDEVAPVAEDCSNDIDEDCDGMACGEALWGKILTPGDPFGYIHKVTGDAQGNIYVVGEYSGGLEVGGETLVSAGGLDAFVIKLDAAGTPLWGRRYGSAADEAAYDVAAHPGGGIVVVGGFTDTLTINGTVHDAGANAATFIVRLDDGGAVVWSARDDASLGLFRSHVAVADTGEIYVGSTVWAGSAQHDARLQKWTASGVKGWSQTVTGPVFESIFSIAVDGSGSVLAAGTFYDGAALEGSPLDHVGAANSDIMVIKLDAAGGVSWVRTLGSLENDTPLAMALGTNGDVFIGGRFGGDLQFGVNVYPNQGEDDAFAAMLSSTGVWTWFKPFGSDDNQRVQAMAPEAGGGIYLAGYFAGSIDLGGETLTPKGATSNGFVARLGADGSHVWSRGHGAGSSYDAVAVADDGTVVLGGSFSTELNLGSISLIKDGSYGELFVAKIAP